MGTNNKLSTVSDQESHLVVVAGIDEISNFDILKDLMKVFDFLANAE